MPIELCAEITPMVLRFAEIEDSQVKVQSYLTIEVLFASMRFTQVGGAPDIVSSRTLKQLLDNTEIIQSISYEQEEDSA